MFSKRKKYEVTDPGFYGQLILDQKKLVRKNKTSPDELIKLGHLFEKRAAMTKEFVNKKFFFRYSFIITLSVIFGLLFFVNFLAPYPLTWKLNSIGFLICLLTTFLMWKLRYPRSGRSIFKKVLLIDPSNVDAYMQLGLIALRRLQKKKAYYYLEKAHELGGGKTVEKKIKAIYQNEFLEFFNRKSENEKKLSRTNIHLKTEISILEEKIRNLENKNSIVSKKEKNIKIKMGQTIRQTKTYMDNQISKIQTDYEKQIADLEQAMEIEEAKKEAVQKKNINLNLKILESKAKAKKPSFDQAAKAVERIMGEDPWNSLSKLSRSYLATAEHAFSLLDKNSVDTDFSLVGMELCKTLETEINLKLVTPFIDKSHGNTSFLKMNRTGVKKDQPIYYTMLAKVADNENYPEIKTLTLGQYLFVLKKTLEGEMALDDYGLFLDDIQESSKIIIGRKFSQKLKIVTQRYRNSIVHYTHMNHQQCQNLRELVFARKDSLLMDTCKINFI